MSRALLIVYAIVLGIGAGACVYTVVRAFGAMTQLQQRMKDQ